MYGLILIKQLKLPSANDCYSYSQASVYYSMLVQFMQNIIVLCTIALLKQQPWMTQLSHTVSMKYPKKYDGHLLSKGYEGA